MKPRLLTMALVLAWCLQKLSAATITVTTTNNDSLPGDGETSLREALTLAGSGDTIAFNIPGAGPHFIQTPLGGYPYLTANNLTIDGYTQPGAQPNTNPILGGNNAVLKIVLDSRDAGSLPSDPNDPNLPARRSTRLLFPGFGDTENAILPVLQAQNLKVRGLCFVSRHTPAESTDPDIYCVAFANGAAQGATGGQVSGCWFGLHPDGSTISGGRASVATFRNGEIDASGLTIGTNGDGTDDPAEFNVHMGMSLAIHIQVSNVKVSGNYVNVFPNGLSFPDLNELARQIGRAADPGNPDAEPHDVEFYENANCTNVVIGTDGDGVADANERNIVANVSYSETMEFWRAADDVVVAGNYFGVGVDGVTESPVSIYEKPDFVRMSRISSSIRVGSNGDGISDDLEGNLLVNISGDRFVAPGDGRTGDTEIAVRRNRLRNCGFQALPFGPSDAQYETYYAGVVADAASVTPALGQVINNRVRGSFAAPNGAPYAFTFLELYRVDPTSLTKDLYWPAPIVHPTLWLASYTDNGPGDLDPDPLEVEFDLTAFGLGDTDYIALAVTYSQDANTSAAGRAVTSPLSNPVSRRPQLRITRAETAGNVVLSWLAAEGAFKAESNEFLSPNGWGDGFLPISTSYVRGRNLVELTIDTLTQTFFFRLRSLP
jgi:hypothetical protein